jgi:toxin FitB
VKYLLDTSIVAELRKGVRANGKVRAWFATLDPDAIFLSVLTIGEIRRAVESLRRRDLPAARAMDGWVHRLIGEHHAHVLPIDLPIVEEWGRLSVPDPLPVIDGLLAATAKVHGLTLATRSVKDVSRTRVRLVNPFDP